MNEIAELVEQVNKLDVRIRDVNSQIDNHKMFRIKCQKTGTIVCQRMLYTDLDLKEFIKTDRDLVVQDLRTETTFRVPFILHDTVLSELMKLLVKVHVSSDPSACKEELASYVHILTVAWKHISYITGDMSVCERIRFDTDNRRYKIKYTIKQFMSPDQSTFDKLFYSLKNDKYIVDFVHKVQVLFPLRQALKEHTLNRHTAMTRLGSITGRTIDELPSSVIDFSIDDKTHSVIQPTIKKRKRDDTSDDDALLIKRVTWLHSATKASDDTDVNKMAKFY